jgi:hypothetical protein
LTSLGVPAAHIHFIGTGIPDGALVHHLDSALERLASMEATDVCCLAWEGGHQDHDASHLVAAAFARGRGVFGRTREMPLYRASYGPFFRVMSPAGGGWERRKISRAEGLRIAALTWRYQSQRRSWIGLFPEAFLKLAVFRRELTRPIDIVRLRKWPHEGTLFYERRFRFPRQRFADASASFIERHLS